MKPLTIVISFDVNEQIVPGSLPGRVASLMHEFGFDRAKAAFHAKKLRRFRTSHIDQVILLNQAGKNSHEHICESLELFASEVLPEFRDDPEHDAWKAGVMSGAIQLEEIDTEAFTDRYGKLAVSVTPAKSASAAVG